MKAEFWKTRSLADLTPAEWDALCDRCGLCCLEKFVDVDSGEVYFSSRTCPFLESDNGHCLIYPDRHRLNPLCIELTAELLPQMNWLPDSCAYRLVAAGHELPAWHHLICGDSEAIHRIDTAPEIKAVSGFDVDLPDQRTVTFQRLCKYPYQK